MKQQFLFRGILFTFFLNLNTLYTGLQLINKPLATQSTQAVYKSMNKTSTQKTKQAHQTISTPIRNDEELIKKAETYFTNGEILKSIELYKQASQLNPLNFNTYFSLGNIFFSQENIDSALANYLQAARINQQNSTIHYNIGLCYKKKKLPHQAINHFKQAIQLKHDYIQAYIQWGILINIMGKRNEAMKLLKKALSITPQDTTILQELGCIYRDQHELKLAIETLSIAYSIEPDNVIIIMELANTFSLSAEYAKALALYQRALTLKPMLNTALYNIGCILKQQGHIAEALEVFEKVLERDPNHSQAHFSSSLCYLTMGKFSVGWPEYEWRWQSFGEKKPKFKNKPYWDGSSLKEKTILIICEQELGNTFQFIRYAKLLHDQGAKIIVLSQRPIKTLLQKCCSYIDSVITQDDTIPDFDYQICLMSLPFICNTETIQADTPYIEADPKLTGYWNTKISHNTFNIGICWQGNSQYYNTLSIPLNHLLHLKSIPGCAFYSLQKIVRHNRLEHYNDSNSIINLSNKADEEYGKFMDTAAIIANLDLVITIDTSIGHLSAALGKPTWILLPYPADWQWMLDRSDTPWYPQVRLFRQKNTGDWTPVIKKVKDMLEKLLAQQIEKIH